MLRVRMGLVLLLSILSIDLFVGCTSTPIQQGDRRLPASVATDVQSWLQELKLLSEKTGASFVLTKAAGRYNLVVEKLGASPLRIEKLSCMLSSGAVFNTEAGGRIDVNPSIDCRGEDGREVILVKRVTDGEVDEDLHRIAVTFHGESKIEESHTVRLIYGRGVPGVQVISETFDYPRRRTNLVKGGKEFETEEKKFSSFLPSDRWLKSHYFQMDPSGHGTAVGRPGNTTLVSNNMKAYFLTEFALKIEGTVRKKSYTRITPNRGLCVSCALDKAEFQYTLDFSMNTPGEDAMVFGVLEDGSANKREVLFHKKFVELEFDFEFSAVHRNGEGQLKFVSKALQMDKLLRIDVKKFVPGMLGFFNQNDAETDGVEIDSIILEAI